jgi:carbamoyltransferase
MTAILGISALYHDAAATLLVDGEVVAAAQEERFTRKKHDDRIPREAVRYCLEEGGISPAGLDRVAYYEKPLLKFERILESCHASAPLGFRHFRAAMPAWFREKLHVRRELSRILPGYEGGFLFPEHHLSHAAAAFYPSPFEEAAVLTVDGVGEWATCATGRGAGNLVSLDREIRYPHSLGLLYSAFTYHCGFKVNSGEYKLMGLAPYGEPRYLGRILEEVIDLKEDGSFRLDLSFFDYFHGLRMTSRKFSRTFGGPPRRPDEPITQREMDLAASVQKATEEALLRMARDLRRRTGLRRLCMAGGVALNCVANGRILREAGFDDLWVQPAADDAGGSLGAAFLAWHRDMGKGRTGGVDRQRGSLLGPAYGTEEVRAVLDAAGASYRFLEDEEELAGAAAALLDGGKVVGWFQGRMEFGPRALGNRSILADPRRPEMRSLVNRKIKFRESFRPFAAAVLSERAEEWFGAGAMSGAAPYMLLVAPVREEKRLPPDPEEAVREGFGRLEAPLSEIPAVTHVDGSTRFQSVGPDGPERFRRLLIAFHRRTGCPVLVNTSLNIRGEPIVRTPGEAWRCFLATGMDALVIDRFLLLREGQPSLPPRERDAYVGLAGTD